MTRRQFHYRASQTTEKLNVNGDMVKRALGPRNDLNERIRSQDQQDKVEADPKSVLNSSDSSVEDKENGITAERFNSNENNNSIAQNTGLLPPRLSRPVLLPFDCSPPSQSDNLHHQPLTQSQQDSTNSAWANSASPMGVATLMSPTLTSITIPPAVASAIPSIAPYPSPSHYVTVDPFASAMGSAIHAAPASSDRDILTHPLTAHFAQQQQRPQQVDLNQKESTEDRISHFDEISSDGSSPADFMGEIDHMLLDTFSSTEPTSFQRPNVNPNNNTISSAPVTSSRPNFISLQQPFLDMTSSQNQHRNILCTPPLTTANADDPWASWESSNNCTVNTLTDHSSPTDPPSPAAKDFSEASIAATLSNMQPELMAMIAGVGQPDQQQEVRLAFIRNVQLQLLRRRLSMMAASAQKQQQQQEVQDLGSLLFKQLEQNALKAVMDMHQVQQLPDTANQGLSPSSLFMMAGTPLANTSSLSTVSEAMPANVAHSRNASLMQSSQNEGPANGNAQPPSGAQSGVKKPRRRKQKMVVAAYKPQPPSSAAAAQSSPASSILTHPTPHPHHVTTSNPTSAPANTFPPTSALPPAETSTNPAAPSAVKPLPPLGHCSGDTKCSNCGVTSTPLWRRGMNDDILCNACGLYYKLHAINRPKDLRASVAKNENLPPVECFNCMTRNTPLWRRDDQNNVLCNACGLYHKLHGAHRPLSMKTDVIRKRLRNDDSPSAAADSKASTVTSPSKKARTSRQTNGDKTQTVAHPPPSSSTESPATVNPDTESTQSQQQQLQQQQQASSSSLLLSSSSADVSNFQTSTPTPSTSAMVSRPPSAASRDGPSTSSVVREVEEYDLVESDEDYGSEYEENEQLFTFSRPIQ
ncbi:hypothetical protein HDV05_001446 [Chytridiales sp. JEL 0842]|nr:hypothetical protein HDV05_001446 [Chytridiales sp. JEL 0842]